MIRYFAHSSGHLVPADSPDNAIWLDLLNPDDDEVATARRFLGAPMPTRADMHEIELSSRLYHEEGADYLTVLVPAKVDGGHRETQPVSFVLKEGRTVTLRFSDPRPFTTFPERAGRMAFGCSTGEAVLLGLLEEIIDRTADIMEITTHELEAESRRLFRAEPSQRPRHDELLLLLETIGRNGDLVTDLRSCLLTIERALAFIGPILIRTGASDSVRAALEVQKQDARSLAEHTNFLSQKTNLMLDATLGVVNIEQNANIKLFSVIAVVFLPPTLIASMYGMNFAHMPELAWPYSYPLALLAMVISAVAPVAWFRRRGWL